MKLGNLEVECSNLSSGIAFIVLRFIRGLMISDPLSVWLFSLQNGLLTFMSLFLDLFTIPIAFLFILSVYFLSYFKYKGRFLNSLRKIVYSDELKKRAFIAILSLMLVIASVQFVKLVYPQDRPCNAGFSNGDKIECPESSSFPSTHTASAAVLIPFTMGTPLFFSSLLFYGLVAFSRMYLGLHYLLDILVATTVGISGFFVVRSALSKENKTIASKSSNLFRAFSHLFFGLFVMFAVMMSYAFSDYPILISLIVLFAILVVLLLMVHMDSFKKKITILYDLLHFISVRDSFIGEGAILFVLGSMILIGFSQDIGQIMAGLYIVTIGDVASAAFSFFTPKKKSFFKNKNIVSFAAFILSTLPVLFILGVSFFPFLFLAALIESIDLKVSDNFLLFVFLTFIFTFII